MQLHNNDKQVITPIILVDEMDKTYYYVESDGRHITAFGADGTIKWSRDPYGDERLEPHRWTKPVIVEIAFDKNRPEKLIVRFNSSQFGVIDKKTGSFVYQGQD